MADININMDKFDRSIRLWGLEGQRALAKGHVVLLGATAAGCEALKNLVLPGLGAVTVVDDSLVTLGDLGSNFFLTQEDLGTGIAAATLRQLLELNPVAAGKALALSPNSPQLQDPTDPTSSLDALKATLVIASSRVSHATLLVLSTICTRLAVPLLFLDTVGIVGVLRVQAPDQFVVHTYPDEPTHDIPVVDPFPALLQWYEAHDPTDPEKHVESHSHIPWPCVLFHAIRQVMQQVPAGTPLDSPATWTKVRAAIVTMTRPDLITNEKKEENMAEARGKCNRSAFVANLGRPLRDAVLADVRCVEPSQQDHVFWFLAHGVRSFQNEAGGRLPQPGTLPDFRCDTQWYRQLQDIFQAKAKEDATLVFAHVQRALVAAGRSDAEASFADVCDFCTNVYDVGAVAFVPIAKEFEPAKLASRPVRNYADCPDSFAVWYAVLRAARLFAQQTGAYPGANTSADAAALAQEAQTLQAVLDTHDPLLAQYRAADDIAACVTEIVRYGGGALCATAAVIGAVAAQEAIKLIQGRRVPLHDAIVFDGNLGVFGTVVVA